MSEQFLTAQEVAKIVQVDFRTIQNWGEQGYLARDNGHYGLISALKYRINQLEEQVKKAKEQPQDLSELKAKKLAAEVRKENAIADIKELERDQLKEKLVLAEEVLIEWSGIITNARAKFLAIPARIALEIAGIDNPEKIQARLTEVIDEALSELSD